MKKLAVLFALILLPAQASAMSQPVISAQGLTSSVSGSTRSHACGASSVSQSSDALAASRIPIAGVLDNLQISESVAPGVGTTRTYTLVKNGVDTAQTCQISDTATTCSDIDSPITFAAGDTCSVRNQSTTGAPAASSVNISHSFAATTDNEAFFTGVTGTTASTTATQYYAIYGGTATSTIARASTTFPTNGTVDRLYVQLSGTPGAGGDAYTATLYRNGVATAITCQVADAATTCNDPTNSASFSAGDSISMEVTPAVTPTARSVKWGLRFLPTINGESVLFVREVNNSNALRYHTVQGDGQRSSAEASVQVIAPLAFQLKKLYFAVTHGQPTAGTSRTLTARKGTATTTLTATINNTTAWATDLTTTVDYAAGDTFNTVMTFTGAPPTAVVEFWSMVAYVAPAASAVQSSSLLRFLGGTTRFLSGTHPIH